MSSAKCNVWNQFVKTDFGGRCKVCLKEVKAKGGNTSNLKRHTQRHHSALKSGGGSKNSGVVLVRVRLCV